MMDLYGSELLPIETSRKPNSPYDILKKALQLLVVPLSLMSLLFSNNYFHFSLALASGLERKYIMFLICNGILAFLANTFRFTVTADLDYTFPPFNIQSPHTLDLDGELGKAIHDDHHDKTKDEEKQEEILLIEGHGYGGALKVVLETEKGEGEEGGGLVDADAHALHTDEEDNDDMNINTEELNRKVEEFIRKMKQEIRIEAKQHLIAV